MSLLPALHTKLNDDNEFVEAKILSPAGPEVEPKSSDTHTFVSVTLRTYISVISHNSTFLDVNLLH